VHVLTRSCCVGTHPSHSRTRTPVSQSTAAHLVVSLTRSLSLLIVSVSSRCRTRQAFSLHSHSTQARHSISRSKSIYVPQLPFFHRATRWHYKTCSGSASRTRYRSIPCSRSNMATCPIPGMFKYTNYS